MTRDHKKGCFPTDIISTIAITYLAGAVGYGLASYMGGLVVSTVVNSVVSPIGSAVKTAVINGVLYTVVSPTRIAPVMDPKKEL